MISSVLTTGKIERGYMKMQNFIGKEGMKKAFESMFYKIGSEVIYSENIVEESIVFWINNDRYKFQKFRDGDCFLFINGVVEKSFRLDD